MNSTKTFLKTNISNEDNEIMLKTWEDNTFICIINKKDLKLVSNIDFPSELSAIYHKRKNLLEVIYAPILSSDETIKREFSFFYKGKEFKTYFGKPTKAFQIIAKGFIETRESSNTEYRNLLRFRDYYKKGKLSKYVQYYFKKRSPINFFIEGDFKDIDFVKFAKELNFYINFYDRKSPTLLIFEKEFSELEFKIPCYNQNNSFPNVINFSSIDPIILDLFEVARKTNNIRLQFIFYYQILEYYAYYYLNDDLKKKLTKIVKRPDLLNNVDEYSKLLIDEFKDHFRQNDDSSKLEKLIIDFCDWDDIKMEISEHKDYFSKNQEFDGNFLLESIILENDNLNIEPNKQILKTIKGNIEKIRNVLVHLRESRENKVILPTQKNNLLLIPYVHLVKRIAEKISIYQVNS